MTVRKNATKPRARRTVQARPTMSVSLPVNSSLPAMLRSFGLDFGHGGWLTLSGGAARETEELSDPYQSEAWVIACVNLHLNVVPGPRARIWDRDPDDEAAQEITSGPLFELFSRVNDYMSPAQFRTHIAQQINLGGDSVVLFRDKAGRPMQPSGAGAGGLIDLPYDMIPVVGSQVGLDLDPVKQEPRAWKVTLASGSATEWPVASALCLYEIPDPTRPFRGIGRVAQAWGPAAQMHLARRFQNSLLRNRGEHGGFITIDGLPVGSAEWRTAEAEMNAEFNNPANAGKTKLLEGGTKYTPNATTPKDMEYAALLAADKEEISAVMATPGGLLGTDVENYATFAGRMLMYLSTRIKPYLTTLADQWNSGFFPHLRDRKLSQYRLRFDTEDLDAAFRDPAAIATALKELQSTGLSMDQARRVVGVKADPHEGSDVPMVATGMVPLEVAIMQSKAAAAQALQMAGVDGSESFRLVGIPATFVEALPEFDPAAPALGEDGMPLPTPAVSADGAAVVADTAFNGAQVSAAQTIVADAAAGKIPRESAIALLVTFFLLTPEQAEAILGPIGNGFEPTPDPSKSSLFGGGAPAGEPPSEPPSDPPSGGSEAKSFPAVARYTKSAGDIATWRRIQRLQKTVRGIVNVKLTRIYLDERRAQLRALEQFAETGTIDRVKACGFRNAHIDVRDGKPTELLPLTAPPTLPEAALVALRQAMADDEAETAALRESDPDALLADVVVDCCGTTERRPVPHEPHQRAWLRRYPWAQRAGLQRCRDLALLHKAQLSELEINQLLVVNDKRWSQAIAGKLTPLMARQYRAAAEDVAHELGIAVIDVTSPAVLAQIASRAVNVAEGTQSVLAARLRSALIEVAAEHGTTGDLQAIVKETLTEMQASTTAAFNSHASRALAVARTETGIANSTARFDQQREAHADGIIGELKWLTSGRGPESAGGTVRDSHYVLEGVTTVPGVPFITGAGNALMHPLDQNGEAAEIVNCQCVAISVLKALS